MLQNSPGYIIEGISFI